MDSYTEARLKEVPAKQVFQVEKGGEFFVKIDDHTAYAREGKEDLIIYAGGDQKVFIRLLDFNERLWGKNKTGERPITGQKKL